MEGTELTSSHGMSIGLGLPQVGRFADAAVLRSIAVQAEAAGFASLWTLDRLLTPLDAPELPGEHPGEAAVLDPMLALTLAAAVTDRIGLGTGVLIAPLHSPVVLARSAATLDRLSEGRFTLGLGLGRSIADLAAAGVPARGRQVRIEQMLEVMARVWRDDVVDIETSRELVVPSRIDLKPAHGPRPPLLLATSRPAGLERTARRADGWIATALPFDTVADRWSTILKIADRYGRDASSLRLVLRADVSLTERADRTTGRAPFTGAPVQIRADIERARDLGAHHVILDLQHTATSEQHLLDLALQLADGFLSPATYPQAA
ncbi:MAG: TIGR03619 family F420-dependent LLM class oxidoreductase [Actinobacteria bacterium]|nr:TIGR03619 family F420-dependent LLM class oxidoreductase [Actinomycetota bacterium]